MFQGTRPSGWLTVSEMWPSWAIRFLCPTRGRRGASVRELTKALYQSIKRLFSLPIDTRVFVCHGYQPNGRELAFEATVGTHKRENMHVRDGIEEAEFLSMRASMRAGRDALLSTPRLMLLSIQVNIRAGALPAHPVSSRPVITMPINSFSDADVTELVYKAKS